MGVDTRIVGVGSSKPAELLRKDRGNGQIVYTEEIRDTSATSIPAFNPTFGISLNQNGAFGGTPVGIHNGIDSVLWTGSQIVGNKVTFDSTDEAFAGTKSVKINNPSVSDVWQFDKGSNQDLSSYSAISFKVFVESNWGVGDNVILYGWDTTTSSVVGVAVNISNYFNETSFGVWQSAVIPLSELGLVDETIDAIRMEQAEKSGPAATFYIDNMQIEESGGGIEYIIRPDAGTIFESKAIVYQWVGVGTGTAAYAYDQIGQIASLSNGLVLRAEAAGVVLFASTFRQLSDFTFSGANVVSVVDDGTNTMVTLNLLNLFGQGQTLDSRSNDFLSVTVNDDLSSLLEFRILVQGNEEII